MRLTHLVLSLRLPKGWLDDAKEDTAPKSLPSNQRESTRRRRLRVEKIYGKVPLKVHTTIRFPDENPYNLRVPGLRSMQATGSLTKVHPASGFLDERSSGFHESMTHGHPSIDGGLPPRGRLQYYIVESGQESMQSSTNVFTFFIWHGNYCSPQTTCPRNLLRYINNINTSRSIKYAKRSKETGTETLLKVHYSLHELERNTQGR
ncbi:hypothetical protein DY000_02030678 [Brassica cretica]|uniref:Uncharacterized protein n=1 Tax=Brassica cretica TaxID=69181 RepID=A0ABQ7DXM9_BRACR|nr:hypothetical protein DY000_02030678 [Brassica cretica]